MNLWGTQFYPLQSPPHPGSHTGQPRDSLAVVASAGSPTLGLFPTGLQSCRDIIGIQKRSQKYQIPRLCGPISLQSPLAPLYSKLPRFLCSCLRILPYPPKWAHINMHPKKPPSGPSDHPHVATALFSLDSTSQHRLTQLRGWM